MHLAARGRQPQVRANPNLLHSQPILVGAKSEGSGSRHCLLLEALHGQTGEEKKARGVVAVPLRVCVYLIA